MNVVPASLLRRNLKKMGKAVGLTRVSEGAVKTLKKILDKKAKEMSESAVKIAKHAGRNTVKEEDVRLVILRK